MKTLARLVTLAMSLVISAAPVGAETVRVAHQADFPPLAYVQDGKSVGLFVDLLQAAAAREGITLEFVPVPFAEVQQTLIDGRAQAIFPLGNIPERRQTFDFSDEFLPTGGALFVRTADPAPENLAALAGKSLVTPRTGPLAGYIAKNAPDVKLILSANYEESLAQVIHGNADAAALNVQVGAQLAAKLYPGQLKRGPGMFAAQPLAVGVTKGQNAALVARLNAGLAAIKADGTWQRINDRWVGR
jgi:polar amino acid transport system substrate-binding protein